MLLIFLLIAAIAITVLQRREHMTNAEVLNAMKHYGVEETPTTKKGKIAKAPILGPSAETPLEEDPDASTGSKDSLILSDYPNIYGPDIPLVPGVKSVDEGGVEPEYNVDLQKLFPNSGGPPKPFLTDFSKFQH